MATLGTVIATIGGAGVTQVSIPTFTDLSGNGTEHTLRTITVPAGQSWLVAVQLNLTNPVTGTSASSCPEMRVGSVYPMSIGQDKVAPATAAVLGAGTHIIGVRTNATLSSYRISGTGTVYTAKM